MARKSAYEKQLEAKRIDNSNKRDSWGENRLRRGKGVISNISEYDTTVSTVIKFTRNGKPMTETVKRTINRRNRPDNPPRWLMPEGPQKDDGKRFQVGHVYETKTYWGSKKQFIVVKRDDKNHMLTIQEYYGLNNLGTDKIRRKIEYLSMFENGHDVRFERIAVDKGTYSQMTRCWTGGYSMSSLDESGGKNRWQSIYSGQ